MERADNSNLQKWYISDPSSPDKQPSVHRYPRAGTANPVLAYSIIRVGDTAAQQIPVIWDAVSFEYVVTASCSPRGPLLTVMNRSQTKQQALRTPLLFTPLHACISPLLTLSQVLLVDPSTGATKLLHEDADSSWLEWIPGLPAFAADGDLLVYQDHIASDTRRVCKVNTAAASRTFVTPAGVQVRSILSHNATGLIFSAVLDSPCVSLHHAAWDGQTAPLLNTDDGGHHLAQCASSADPDSAVIVIASSALVSCETQFRVIVKQRECGHIANNQISPALASPPVIPNPILLKLTPASLATVLLFPKSHLRGSCRLPLIMCPYGGPHHAKAIANGRSHALAQYASRCQPALACNPPHVSACRYIADLGFAVAIADGRGTPGRGPVWDRSVHNDLASPALEDQAAAVGALATLYPADIDTGRVGIIGWSFGGYLAALAVLKMPHVFHAAVAGAPVTEWRLYDTGLFIAFVAPAYHVASP